MRFGCASLWICFSWFFASQLTTMRLCVIDYLKKTRQRDRKRKNMKEKRKYLYAIDLKSKWSHVEMDKIHWMNRRWFDWGWIWSVCSRVARITSLDKYHFSMEIGTIDREHKMLSSSSSSFPDSQFYNSPRVFQTVYNFNAELLLNYLHFCGQLLSRKKKTQK